MSSRFESEIDIAQPVVRAVEATVITPDAAVAGRTEAFGLA
jgi:hypothetical protein